MEKIVQVRKKMGLRSIKTSNGNVNPSIFHQDTKNPDADGTPVGTYRSSGLPNTKQFMSPSWDPLKRQYCWGGTEADLERLILKLKLKYPKDHPEAGKFIKPGDVKYRLKSYGDEVFENEVFYGARFWEAGKASLQNIDPIEEFLYHCYVGNPKMDQKGNRVSKYIQSGTTFEMVSPKEEKKEKADNVDVELESIELLLGMVNNEERMRAVCNILQLPGYDFKTTEASSMKVLLKEAADSTDVVARYGNKQVRTRFIEVAKMDDEDLFLTGNIMKAKKMSFLQKRKDHYLFQGEKLDGLLTDQNLVEYFKNPKNFEHYEQLVTALETL